MRLDSRRPDDKCFGPFCEFRQNGEIMDDYALCIADENLGVVECFVSEPCESVCGPSRRWKLGPDRQPLRVRTEGPVEIRLKPGAPAEIAQAFRERRREEGRR